VTPYDRFHVKRCRQPFALLVTRGATSQCFLTPLDTKRSLRTLFTARHVILRWYLRPGSSSDSLRISSIPLGRNNATTTHSV
jgi:hypothetical protein